jgi:hypothetical protein
VEEEVVITQEPGFKFCAICGLPSRSKKDYLSHFKAVHAGIKLGCPKCSQTYHSPELLQVHYKHFHMRETPIFKHSGVPKRAHVMMRCEYCDVSLLSKVVQCGQIGIFSNVAEEEIAKQFSTERREFKILRMGV